MKKVLFILTIPSPYRVDFFNELGKKVELTVLFEKGQSDERDEIWKNYCFTNFKGIIMKSWFRNVNKAFCPEIRKYLTREWDEIVCCNATTLTGMLAIQTLKHRKIPFWIEGDGAFVSNKFGIKEVIKKRLYRGAKGYFSTCKEHDKYYISYGVEKDKIFRYPFSSVSEANIIPNDSFREDLRKNARKELNISNGTKMVLVVGRFIYIKGFDILLNAIPKSKKDIEYYFVGGNPTDEYIELVKKYELKNVHFIGFKDSKDLAQYYIAANVFVFPTRGDTWGLVINEAMAYGLPVITTNRCNAGLEMIQDGINGYIVPVGDGNELSRKIEILINDDSLRKKCTKNALITAHRYTIETMVDVHIKHFKL